MPRVIWKGAISFGLVHVPVGLYPASREDDIDFDWLDKRSMDPVGYKRINKRTGREIRKEDIVKGVKLDDGEYVLISDEEIREAYPQSTQTIAIEAFVKASEISFPSLEKPYFLAPVGKAGKVYALLREAMLASGCIGIARVVMHSKEHLAALIPSGQTLMLNTLRWPAEIRAAEDISFPPAGKSAAGVKESELKMAQALIADMTKPWQPEDYTDQFRAAITALIEQKAEEGQTERVTPLEAPLEAGAPSNVVDLTELLKRSLAGKKGGTAASDDGAESKEDGKRGKAGSVRTHRAAKPPTKTTKPRAAKSAAAKAGKIAAKAPTRKTPEPARRRA